MSFSPINLWNDLRRRRVFQVAALYAAAAWVIIQVADVVQDPLGIPDPAMTTLVAAIITGFPVTVILAWIFDLGPDGVVRTKPGSPMGVTAILVSLGLLGAGTAGLVLLVGTENADEPVVASGEELPIEGNSVAVLPFVNLSNDPDNEYFSDGLTETLLHMLAQVSELKVPARTSSFAFKGTNKDVRDIASELGVAHVLEGSVQRTGNRVRVTAQLIRADDGFHIWSQNHDRDLTDIFAIQDEIAAEVGITLLAALMNPNHLGRGVDTTNFDAYDQYLKARAEKYTGSHEAYLRAEQHLEQALEIDPAFLDAKARLAEVLMDQADTGMISYEEGFGKATELADEVLASNPAHVKARVLQLILEANEAGSTGRFSAWQDIEPRLREVVRQSPDDIDAKLWFAFLLSSWGNREEAVSTLERALEVDPLNLDIYFHLGMAYDRIRDYESARNVYERSLEIEPGSPNTWQMLADTGLKLGDGELAISGFLEATAVDAGDPELPMSVASLLYRLGLPDEARPFHDQVIRERPDSEATQLLAMQRAMANGALDEALVVAREVIAGFPPERYYGWLYAWPLVMFTSVERNSEKEDLAFVEQHIPGFLDLDKIEVHGQINTIRANSMDVLAALKSTEELKEFGARAVEHYRQIGYREDDFPHVNLEGYVLRGEIEEGIQWALEKVFPMSPTRVRLWRLRFSREFLKPIMDDPRVKKELERWDREEARMREEVRAYLAERA